MKYLIKLVFSILFIFTFCVIGGCKKNVISKNIVQGHAYYIDAINGSDSNDGMSFLKAWKTLDQINTKTFNPGDSILFKCTCEWIGQLQPNGSGVQNHPIYIGKYGSGALPIISLGNLSGNAILILNQDNWEISNIEVWGGSSKPSQQVGGIQVQATTAGRVLKNIYIHDCIIRNILGSIANYQSCAIWVGVPGWNSADGLTTSFENVVIENNQIYTSDRCGILMWTCAGPGPSSQFQSGLIPSQNVIIRNNLLEDIGGDAILVLGSSKPLIEKNVVKRCCIHAGDPTFGTGYNTSAAAIWLHHCEQGIMQNNAVYNCVKLPLNNDGMAYDFDFNCDKNILQYCYSNSNAGGFLLIMPSATNNIARYNISENDQNHILYLTGALTEQNNIYNNSFYLSTDSAYIVPNALISNNIFMAVGNAYLQVQNPAMGIFQNNCYAGNWGILPSDQNKVVSDPQFSNPGNGGQNAEYLNCYNLQKSSPCISKGTLINNNGGKDILGNNVPQNGNPDIGAIQHQ